jgi:regulator of sirC expression with transglutaminase-like and TPR domain
MSYPHLFACGILVILFESVSSLPAQEDKKGPEKELTVLGSAPSKALEQLVEKARQSVVVITFTGRNGKQQGLGTGFVVEADGLIATNLHVIGEARPITVKLANGKHYEVTDVYASDRSLDLALLRIRAKDLPALELGDSDGVKQGQPIVAFGNPLGLTYSVVSGVVSSKREVEGRPMIQLAIPLERGNSGGPMLDLQGRVQGIITMKSLVTANLGFAMPVNALKTLLKKPNPVPISRWLTIGTLDPEEWTPIFEAHWRQRAGHIQVEGEGSGFGGRSLCLLKRPVPEPPYEIAVTVRLDDEAGAAGLAFAADGGDNHYGFYPSAGNLRLTRFAGPDVYSWKILRQEGSPHYRPGEWNTLKVRVENDKLRCFLNGELMFDSTDFTPSGTKVGLAKFRDTVAEFKDFRVAKEIPSSKAPADLTRRITKSIEGIAPRGPLRPELVNALAPDGQAGMAVLRDRAKVLEQQAGQLRRLAQAIHSRRIESELVKIWQGKEEEIDLFHAALLVAKLDNDELDIEPYRRRIERMAKDVTTSLPKEANDQAKLGALNQYLFSQQGFHGSRGDYYNRANSYLNEVLDDREGIPITLSVLYMELARRIGLKMLGIPLPAHFVVQFVPAKGEGQLIDVFDGGKELSKEEANRLVLNLTGKALEEKELTPATKKAIIVRILRNLMKIAGRERDADKTLHYLDAILAIDPEAARERMMRALLRFQTGERQGALHDTDWLLEHHTAERDQEQIMELRRMIEREKE